MVSAAASSWPALLSLVFWVRSVAALASNSRRVRNTRIGARPFIGEAWAAELGGGGKEILCQIRERGAGSFLHGKNLGNRGSQRWFFAHKKANLTTDEHGCHEFTNSNGPIELFLIRVNQCYPCYLW